MARSIGIDLGTTNTCVATVDPMTRKPRVIPSPTGGLTTPSVVAFLSGDRVLVGEAARRQAVVNPAQTLLGIKRLIGRTWDSPEVQSLRQVSPFEIVRGPRGEAFVRAGGRDHGPAEISALLLKAVRAQAEAAIGETVTDAVITVPAYFDDAQRQATKDAGALAGLNVRRLLNEPTAAALAYGVHERGEARIAVFDLGGGTFDVSLVELHGDVFQVLATSGDTFLGGDDFDRAIVGVLLRLFERQTGVDLAGDQAALMRLREAAETAKKQLSEADETAIRVPFIMNRPEGPLHLDVPAFTRKALDTLAARELARLEAPCRQALDDAGLRTSDLTEVLLVGGMTRMAAVRAEAARIFQREPTRGVHPDEAVAIGAAIEADLLAGDTTPAVVLLDITSHSLGIRTKGGTFQPVVPRNTPIPMRQAAIFRTVEDNQDFVLLEIYQGEHPTVEGNRLLGELTLSGLTRAPAGTVRVEVDLMVDVDGILHVTAQEVGSRRMATVSIRSPGAL